jgi:acylphosphatase
MKKPQQQQRQHPFPRGGIIPSLKSRYHLKRCIALIFLSVTLFVVFKFPSARTNNMLSSSLSSESKDNNNNNNNNGIGGYSFEIHGKVQGVYFRKYTQTQAREIGDVVGWIRNTSRGTVVGEVASRSSEGRQRLKVWLQTTGSPKSEITMYEFKDLTIARVQELLEELDDFVVQRTKKRR